jgi:hypothetical protein
VICILCGQNISSQKQKSVPIRIIEFQPFIGDIDPSAMDTITHTDCCQDCYTKVHINRAKSIAEYGKIKDVE